MSLEKALPKSIQSSLDQWLALQAVVETGSFARAAEHLFKSQSTISYSVQKLQEQLGIQLLEIKGRKAELTPAGELLLRRSQALTEEAVALERTANALANGWESEISVTVDIIFPNEIIFNALSAFESDYPDTRIDLFHTSLSGTSDATVQRTTDVVFAGLPPTGFSAEFMLTSPMILVAHPNHPLQLLDRDINEHDLKTHRQIVVRDSGQRRRLDAGWLGAEKRWTVNGFQESKQLLMKRLGFAWLPFHAIEENLADETLKPLPFREGGVRAINNHIVFPDRDIVGPATQTLTELVRKEAKIYQRKIEAAGWLA